MFKNMTEDVLLFESGITTAFNKWRSSQSKWVSSLFEEQRAASPVQAYKNARPAKEKKKKKKNLFVPLGEHI